MTKPVLYYNPNCSKCRAALNLLNERELDFEAIDILQTKLPDGLVKRFYEAFGDRLLREKVLTAEGLDKPSDLDAVLKSVELCPQAMERPILLVGDRLLIARPPELVLQYLGSSSSTPELKKKLAEVEERISELTTNLKNLRSGGCALETLLDSAVGEREAIEVELSRRG